MSGDSARILMIGLEDNAIDVVRSFVSKAKLTLIKSHEEFSSEFEQWADDQFNLIICGSSITGVSSTELAQVLVNQCPNTTKYYLTYDSNKFEPRVLLKNGFTKAFMLPMDASLLKKTIDQSDILSPRKERVFRTVRLNDIDSGEPLGFDTFLFFPLNKKYIRYISSDLKVDPLKVEKLQSRSITQVYVDQRDMNKFYQYTAKKLRELGEGGVSSTENQEKLRDSVRALFTEIFDASAKADFEVGREIIKQCESVISNYITKGASSSWYKKLMSSIGESEDVYHHASNVSTFAALFGIGIGHKRPEDLAIAGLFHDLGMNQLPEELQNKREEDLEDQERESFYSHIEKGLTLIKNKRIIIPEAVEKAINQHHEKFNGKGWPKQTAGNRISEDAQILSLADQFDYLTRIEPGKARMNPLEAIDAIRSNGSINPELISQIRRLLNKESSNSK